MRLNYEWQDAELDQVTIDGQGIHLPASLRVRQVQHAVCDRCSTVLLTGMWPTCRPGKDPVEEHGKPTYSFYLSPFV